MPSGVKQDLEKRLQDIIKQLVDSHKAITQVQACEAAASRAGGELREPSKVVNALVHNPGRGKAKEVDAINRAAFVLLSSHLQGFVDPLHNETAIVALTGKVEKPEDTIKLIKPRNFNLHVDVIEKMFASLGMYDLMKDIHGR